MLIDIAEENIQDANERMESLEPRSPEWIKQRRRRLENHFMKVGLKNPDMVNKTRARLKETYFSPVSFLTIPPAE